MAKTLTGKVTSDRADKTITVTVTSRETHPIYRKQFTVNRKYIAHDEQNDAHVGDIVTISEVRPISKRKSFRLASIDKRSVGSVKAKADIEDVIAPSEEAK